LNPLLRYLQFASDGATAQTLLMQSSQFFTARFPGMPIHTIMNSKEAAPVNALKVFFLQHEASEQCATASGDRHTDEDLRVFQQELADSLDQAICSISDIENRIH
jgi:hypothetical protein